TMVLRHALAMGVPPLDQSRRDHGERKIDEHKDPQSLPVARNLPEARTQLVDAHDSVDREIGGEDGPDGLRWVGDSFARPSEAGQEELRQAGAEEDERRRFWTLEPDTGGLPHEAGRKNE